MRDYDKKEVPMLVRISFTRVILSPMNEMIIATISWIWVLSIAVMLFKFSCAGFTLIQSKLAKEKTKKTMRLETETKIKELSPMERKVLVYVQSGNNCGVWVAQKDATVQTLIHKGLLEQIGNVSQFDDWNGERVICILVMLIPCLKEYNFTETVSVCYTLT